MPESPKTTLEDVTKMTLYVRDIARLCSTEEIMLSVARLRDAMGKRDEPDPLLEARHQTLEGVLAQRATGRAKQVWWHGFSIHQGTAWAIERLSGLEKPK